MSFAFDNQPTGVQRYAGTVYNAFKKESKPPPTLSGYAFLSSTKVRPLQAADLVAWELYSHANVLLEKGFDTPAHKEMLHLTRNMDFQAQIATRKRIEQVRDHWLEFFKDKPGWPSQFAHHFDTFDLKKPDYSTLSGQPTQSE